MDQFSFKAAFACDLNSSSPPLTLGYGGAEVIKYLNREIAFSLQFHSYKI